MISEHVSKNLLASVFTFIVCAQLLYTYQNIHVFNNQYKSQTHEQVYDLGVVIRNEISTALKYNIPLKRLGRVNLFLKSILDDTPHISYIDIIQNGQTLYTASRTRESKGVISVPISNTSGKEIAVVNLGVNPETKKQAGRILFDLFTIVMVGLIVTYELLIFFTSRMLHVPNQEALLAANCLISNLRPFSFKINSRELSLFLSQICSVVETVKKRLDHLNDNLGKLSGQVASSAYLRKEQLLNLISEQQGILARLTSSESRFEPIVNPDHVRPLVFTFIIAANIHSTFLPFFAKELLASPTFLSNLLSEKLLMGLPITAYMTTIMLTMIVLGAGVFGTIRPFRIISMSLLSTAGGLILCGLSENLIMLIVGRMICGVGFGMIILPARQFIVDNSSVEKRAYHLAGYTTAFSGGLFSSIVIGGIIADYFSYRTVFFFASAVLLLVLVFAYLVFSDQPAPSEVAPAQSEGLRQFMSLGLRDQKLLAAMFQGVITRIMLLGFYYYSIPIFLRVKFTYADIGRIMMFYGLTTIFFASFLNRYIKELKQSKNAVVVSNLLLGAALFAFYFLRAEASVYLALTAIGGLIILALSNCFTFPSQINLLLDTDTVKEIGHRVPMAVNEAFMRIGSALGPLVFGYFATYMDIQKAIGLGGVVCLAGNILFMFFYRGDKRPRKEEDLL